MSTSRNLPGLVLVSACCALLAGCGASAPTKPSLTAVAADCVYPDAPTVPAPGWICDGPVEGVAIAAAGSAQKTAAGPEFMKQMAATAARVQLAQRMKLRVQNLIKQYVETTGAGTTETVDKVNTSVTKQITDQTLTGTRIMRSITSPSGSMYVLVGMDPAETQKVAEDALKTSMNNDAALWQQFKAEKGMDELAKEIAAGNK